MAKWIPLSLLGVVLVVIGTFIAWHAWRIERLQSFCDELKPGTTIAQLISLETRHGIDNSYLMNALLPNYVDRAHSQSLDYRNQALDADIACLVDHDGNAITGVRSVP